MDFKVEEGGEVEALVVVPVVTKMAIKRENLPLVAYVVKKVSSQDIK